jgi:CubicO group peptidase (beta-lactamase class C family)
MKTNDEKQFPSGSAFNYSNFDTVALGLLVQAATKLSFSEYFEKTIWHDVGAESRGAWMINGNGQASTYQGFSARPHDWIRLGVMVLNELGNKDSCFGKFLTDATSHQVASIGPATSYGYQIWIGCHASETNFCFVGFGGQYLLFNVETNTVIYHHATTFSRVVWQIPQVMDALLPALAKAK